ncbi:DUF3108 domain-containing protein [Chloroflexota bacterium]
MNKFGIIIALALVIGLIVSGCAGNSEPEPEPEPEPMPINGIFAAIPWQERELLDYVMYDYSGNETGAIAMTLARELDDSYVLKQVFIFQQQVYTLLTITKVRADNLKPVNGMITLGNISPAPLIKYSYGDGVLNIASTDTENNLTNRTIDLPEDAYDDNELFFMLRALPFKVGYTASFTNIIVASGAKYPVTVTVVGEEELQSPAGAFNTYKVELDMAEVKQYLWYAQKKPHFLIKLDDGESIILLSEIAEEL